jgi:potassium/hydrogen antiporter
METMSGAWAVLLVVLIGGLVVAKLTERPRIPDVAAFLLLGLLVGPYGFGWISEPSGSPVNQFILYLGAVIILYDGGRSVSFSILRQVWLTISMLAVVGVLASLFLVAAFVHFVFRASWLEALLLGSVLASTDPATLIPVFKRVTIFPKLRQTVESESAFNDATGSVIVFTLADILSRRGPFVWWQPIESFLQQVIVGIAVGLAIGLLSLWLVSIKGWGVFHEFGSIVLFSAALGAYQASVALHGSGFMAAFVAGVISGNGVSFGWPFVTVTEERIQHFGSAMTLIFRMLIFVLLGTQVDFTMVANHWVLGVATVLFLMVVARPGSVLISVFGDRMAKWRMKEILFMFWVRETGVIPAALSVILVSEHVPYAKVIASVTFMAILFTILIQASTTGMVARWLGVLDAPLYEEI